jgi:hypothetical protein
MYVRFHIDPVTGEPHIYEHDVAEAEVLEILRTSTDRGPAGTGGKQAIGQTRLGRYLKVIYVEDPDSVFVVTAYDLRGRELKAFRRRRRRRPR